MTKIIEICSSHYVLSNELGKEIFVSYHVVSDQEPKWVVYLDNISESGANYFDNKHDAIEFAEHKLDEETK